MTDVLFQDVTFALASGVAGPMAIGNGQGTPHVMNLVDVDGDGFGLVFDNVEFNSSAQAARTRSVLYTTTNGAMQLDGVDLIGTDGAGPIGAQWNMTNRTGPAAIEIVDSGTSGGGNFYVSGFASAIVRDNTFDGQGIDLNGVKFAEVTGNTF